MNKLHFRHVANISAIACFALALTWLFAPTLLLWLWGIAYSYQAGLMGRRGAALFFGIGIMFYLVRHAPPGAARSAIAYGFAGACLALAALGLFEWLGGHAGIGILSAVIPEIALALALFHVCKNTANAQER